MTQTSEDFNGAVHCHLVLKPSRSLTDRGTKLYYGGLAACALFANFIMFRAGAWPVALMFDLVAGGVAAAMMASKRSGKEYQRIVVTDSALDIYHYKPGYKAETRTQLSPYQLRVETVMNTVDSCEQLLLVARGKTTEIGKFLPPEEKLEVAAELRKGLARCGTPFHLRNNLS